MKKKFFIALFIVAAIGVFIFADIVLNKNVNAYQPQQNIKAPIEIPDTGIVTIQDTFYTDKPVVALFYVDWCSYCRKFMPVFGQFAKKYGDDYVFAAVNCDLPENQSFIKSYSIMGFPSVFIIDNKLDFQYALNTSITVDNNSFSNELDKYIKLRNKALK